MNLLYMVATGDGVNLTVLVAYRMCFGAAVMYVLSIIFERDCITKLTWMTLLKGFFCRLFGGSLSTNLYIESLSLTSPTYTVAMLNLVPVITFILAVIFRLEKLSLQTTTGKVKIIGIVMGIGGAMVFNLYRGKEINMWSTHVDLLHTHGEPHTASHKSPQGLLWGCMLSLGGCVSYALWFLVQENQIKNFPYPYSSTALTSLMASIQSVIFAFCVERDWKQWKLVLMASYSGILISGLALILMTWGVKKEGPFFVSVFQPVLLVMVALAGSFLLDEKLHMGSILGGLLIVVGLYAILWASSKDKSDSQPTSTEEMFIHSSIAHTEAHAEIDDGDSPSL
ncbi:hypothetical protein PRUPE_7G041900 [Prunus persica]|uniref:WAT1-related protein n=1 Tax=Prunus persica TaxID=3760 RepID=A0A251N6L2_PRUPE|nr:hypothetical protein PRUPE_7G041900 [Prunus persica]